MGFLTYFSEKSLSRETLDAILAGIRRASATLGPSDFKSKNRAIQIAFLRTTVFTAAGLSPPA
jgi:hypothetical protein